MGKDELMLAHERNLSIDAVRSIRGRVVHGDKIGRTIGFPTANMILNDQDKPAYGIYASRVTLTDGRILDGATNFGIRPTFSPPKELLETYLFDFNEDIYDQEIDVELVHFLRPEAKFDDLPELISQMTRDCDAARTILLRIRND